MAKDGKEKSTKKEWSRCWTILEGRHATWSKSCIGTSMHHSIPHNQGCTFDLLPDSLRPDAPFCDTAGEDDYHLLVDCMAKKALLLSSLQD
jgi:hypothetical protein